MRFYDRMPIKHKLTMIIMATSTLVLLLSSGVFLWSDIVAFRRGMISQISSLAGIIGATSRLPLVFRDTQSIQEALSVLEAEPNITLGIVFNRRTPVARYLRHGESLARQSVIGADVAERLPDLLREGQTRHFFTGWRGEYLDVLVPIHHLGEQIGAVYLRSDLTTLRGQMLRLLLGATALLGLSFLVACLLSVRLQRVISRPILQLVDKMKIVSDTRNFSVRAMKTSEDEIGILIDGFNQMLIQIELRDRQLEQHRHTLEDQVQERTAELQSVNQRLKQAVLELGRAMEAAESANRSKSLFLANMSHEIRTPMIGVMGMTELLQRTELTERQRGMTETISRSGEALLTILNDILDFSKIEAGKLELEKIEFDPGETVEEAVELLAEKALAKGLEIVLDFEPEVPRRLIGDPGRLRQIVLNLLSNAIKFTDEGEIVIRLGCRRSGRKSALLQLAVVDTGIGIDREAQARIFDSFSQADDSTSRYFGGTGLGLSIVKQLVQLMGGKIGVESRPEKGAAFRLTLRLERPRQTRPWKTVSSGTADWQGSRALIASGSPSLRSMLRAHLAAMGLVPEEAGDAGQIIDPLLQAIRNGNPFRLLILDAAFFREREDLAGFLGNPALADLRTTVLDRPDRSEGESPWREGVDVVMSWPVRPSRLPQLLPDILGAPRTAPGHPFRTVMEEDSVRLQGHVLVVEDNPSTQRLLQIILESVGCRVSVGSSGSDALALGMGEEVDLILMDCQLPGMDGFEASRQLRRRGFQGPIVALTANFRQEDEQACREAGMDDFLAKPFKHRQFTAVLERWLRHAPARPETPA